MLDLNSHTSIIEAAEPFDISFQKGRPVMLAGSELVGFARHVAAEVCGARQVPGRRASDCAKADRIAVLEAEVARLQSLSEQQARALALGDALRNRERRFHTEPVEVDRRVAPPR